MSGKGWYCPITMCPFVVKLPDKMVPPLLFFNATDPPVKSSSVTVAASDCPEKRQSADSKNIMVSPDVIVRDACFFIVVSFPAKSRALRSVSKPLDECRFSIGILMLHGPDHTNPYGGELQISTHACNTNDEN